MTRTAAVLAAMPFLLAGPAYAEATEEGAQRLTEVFQTYLGATEGVVGVEVDGDSYTLTLDATPLIALAKDSGVTGSMTPFEMTLTDNGDGTWDVSQDQALSISFAAADMLALTGEIAQMSYEGTFDESLMTFSSGKGQASGMTFRETVTEPGQPPVDVTFSLESMTYEATAAAGASGGVDITSSMTGSNFVESFMLPPMGDGAPPMPVSFKAESMTQNATGTGLMYGGIYKLVAFFVANPDEAAIEAKKGELKAILSEAVPLWANISAPGTMSKITIDTPVGPAAIDEVTAVVDINGLVADGKFREGITLSGVTLPPGVIPEWATPILPSKLSIDFQLTDFDAAAATQVALGLLDQPAGGMMDEDAIQAQLLAALLPGGNVTITLNPGEVSGDGYALTYEGAMQAGPATGIPTGKALVTLTGIDKLQAAIGNAPDEIKAQAGMGIGMAQGMAKQDGDKLVWEIDASTPGSLLVNGVNMMGQ